MGATLVGSTALVKVSAMATVPTLTAASFLFETSPAAPAYLALTSSGASGHLADKCSFRRPLICGESSWQYRQRIFLCLVPGTPGRPQSARKLVRACDPRSVAP